DRLFVRGKIFDDGRIAVDVELVKRLRARIFLGEARGIHFESGQIISDEPLEFRIAHHDDAGVPIDDLGTALRIYAACEDVIDRLLKKVGGRRPAARLHRNHAERGSSSQNHKTSQAPPRGRTVSMSCPSDPHARPTAHSRQDIDRTSRLSQGVAPSRAPPGCYVDVVTMANGKATLLLLPCLGRALC